MKNLFLITACVAWFAAGISCNNSDITEKENIIGKWKLVKVVIPFINETSDYSQYEITYEFNKNGTLDVSGKNDHIEGYRGHEAGEYSYSIKKDEIGFRLTIDNLIYGYSISSEKLEISNAHLDGCIYYFSKIY